MIGIVDIGLSCGKCGQKIEGKHLKCIKEKRERQSLEWFKLGLDLAIRNNLTHYGEDLFMKLYKEAKKTRD